MHPAVWILGGLAALLVLKKPSSGFTSGAGSQGGGPLILLPQPVPATLDPASQDPFQYDWLPLGSCQDGTLANCLPGDNGYPLGSADPFTVTA